MQLIFEDGGATGIDISSLILTAFLDVLMKFIINI